MTKNQMTIGRYLDHLAWSLCGIAVAGNYLAAFCGWRWCWCLGLQGGGFSHLLADSTVPGVLAADGNLVGQASQENRVLHQRSWTAASVGTPWVTWKMMVDQTGCTVGKYMAMI